MGGREQKEKDAERGWVSQRLGFFLIHHIEVNGTEYDRDEAQICVGKKEGEVLGAAVEVLPATGFDLGTSLLALSSGVGMLLIGLGVRRFSEAK